MRVGEINNDLVDEIKREYPLIIERLKEGLSLARRYESLYNEYMRNSDDYIMRKACESLLESLKVISGEWIENDLLTKHLSDFDDEFIHIEDATPAQIISSLREDIEFFERGIKFSHTGHHKGQSKLIDIKPNEHSMVGLGRTDYSDKPVYAFKSTKYGTSSTPTIEFENLDEAVEFMSHTKEAEGSVNIRGAIWKSIRECDKGRTAFGFRWSLESNLNKMIKQIINGSKPNNDVEIVEESN